MDLLDTAVERSIRLEFGDYKDGDADDLDLFLKTRNLRLAPRDDDEDEQCGQSRGSRICCQYYQY